MSRCGFNPVGSLSGLELVLFQFAWTGGKWSCVSFVLTGWDVWSILRAFEAQTKRFVLD
jgi:hypothetical protein